MNAAASVADKIAALIPRLASNSDGEVVATVRTIGRQLKKAGSDWHDLADNLTSAQEKSADGDVVPVFFDYLTAVDWMLAINCGELTARDISFCKDMSSILCRWPPKPKQAAWLRSLVEKLGGRFDG